MKVKNTLTSLGLVTVLLAGGTCYAENKENPIVARTEYGYIRLNMPSVQKIDFYGRYFIQCSYSRHFQQYLPYGIPVTSDSGAEYIWFEPLTNREIYFGKVKTIPKLYSVDIKKLTDIKGGDGSMVYGALQENFPELCAEVRAANETANEKYGQELDKGLAALANYDPETVYTYFKKAYDKGCTSLQMLGEMASACWNMGDYDKALEWNSKAIELSPSSRTYNNRAWNYYLLGNNEQALADVNMALSLDGNYAVALDTRGCIYHDLGQYDKAIADFNKSIQLKSDDGHNYYYRGKCYSALGEKEKAAADYTQAKKLWPDASDDKLNFATERRNAVAYKRARRQIRHDKYQQDLKKLNDAIYVTNNSSNFSTLEVCEQNKVIIHVAGTIRDNEPEDFYEEVIPQAVRTDYENGTYQQQYEKLKAELESNPAPVATNENTLKYSADGVMIEVPTTLPIDTSKEIYDLQKTKEVLIYKANNELYEGTFMLTCEAPMTTYRAVIPASAQEQNPNLPDMWYKINNVKYPEAWEAFTYDKTTGVFSFYTDYENKIINFANYWFIDINHLESRRTDKSMPIGVDAVFKRLSGGDYWTDQTFISPTITDGMLCFLHYVKK